MSYYYCLGTGKKPLAWQSLWIWIVVDVGWAYGCIDGWLKLRLGDERAFKLVVWNQKLLTKLKISHLVLLNQEVVPIMEWNFFGYIYVYI